MMRAASGLMIATLITTSAISSTFAKYASTGSGSDTARVAKWGVELAVSGSLYGKDYSANPSNKPIAVSDSNGATVKASDASNVVAPGTRTRTNGSSDSDDGLYISVTGKPEVRTTIAATVKTKNIYLVAGTYGVMLKATGLMEDNFKLGTYYEKNGDGSYTKAAVYKPDLYMLRDEAILQRIYYPVGYYGAGSQPWNLIDDSLSNLGASIAKSLGATDAEINAAKTSAVEGVTTYQASKTFEPNTDLSVKLRNLAETNISWHWGFEQNDNVQFSYDGADTILGDLMSTMPDSEVVMKTSGYGELLTYKPITVDSTTKLAKVGDETVACLETSFDITLTATQAD